MLDRSAELRRFTRILARPSDPREKRATPAESPQTRQQWSATLPQAELRRGPRSLAQIACCASDEFHPARKARQWRCPSTRAPATLAGLAKERSLAPRPAPGECRSPSSGGIPYRPSGRIVQWPREAAPAG